jgi:hypothetical protein
MKILTIINIPSAAYWQIRQTLFRACCWIGGFFL